MNKTIVPTNTPLHHPLYNSVRKYGGDCIGVSILMEVEERHVKRILDYTPFTFISPYAWVEAYVYPSSWGLSEYDDQFGDPYGSFGVVIPARYKDYVGGYYAHCFKNKDYGMAPGREVSGFPIKYATLRMQKTGRAVTASIERPTARMDLSLVIGEAGTPTSFPSDAVRSPNLLIRSIPSPEVENEVMLQQVIWRDVISSSDLVATPGEAAVNIFPAASGSDELAWLANAKPVYGEFFSGAFRGALGKIISTDASESLLKHIGMRP